jgi:GNAT superfamily N-acetyltransferase
MTERTNGRKYSGSKRQSLYCTQQAGLVDLFGGSHGKGRLFLENEFFTLRLEHREGGAMAQHRGEARLLLFRSDRNGAIAKIIYSINSKDGGTGGGLGGGGVTEHDDDKERDGKTTPTIALPVVQAKIHVLDVKQQYRGNDLGGLLFAEAMALLKQRCFNEGAGTSSIHCQLDAEEDCARHDRLVAFYQQLGCQIRPNSRERYMNNNDGGMYRKVQMQISLHSVRVGGD